MSILHKSEDEIYIFLRQERSSSSGSFSVGDYENIDLGFSSTSVTPMRDGMKEKSFAQQSIWDAFQEVLQHVSKSELDRLPSDAASEIDHYVYGTPKKKVMSLRFADTCFWVALMNPRDSLHRQAHILSEQYTRLITSQEVLGEFMNFFCKRGDQLRQIAVELTRKIQENPNIVVVEQTPKSFRQGMELYALRLDKEYSFIDCISMATMREKNISEILTNDHHFSQEGFRILMPSSRLSAIAPPT